MDVLLPSHLIAGQLMPDFHLISSEGQYVAVSDYRGHRNLVLVFVGSPSCNSCHQLLTNLARSYPEFLAWEAEVLVVVQCSIREAGFIKHRYSLPFPVLADEGGQVHRAVGAWTADRKPAVVIYITDRFGEICKVYRLGQGHPLPTPAEMLEWLRFIEIQCPECGAPEWPA